jgi:hypothetical protein
MHFNGVLYLLTNILSMKECGEQCTVVFALIVTEPEICKGRGLQIPPPFTTHTLTSRFQIPP